MYLATVTFLVNSMKLEIFCFFVLATAANTERGK